MEKFQKTINRNEKSILDDENIAEQRSQKTQNILKSLRIIFRAIQAHSRLVQKESGVSSTQLWMLWEIFKDPGMKVTKLAKILSVHQSTCSNILGKLQNKQLIKRERSGPDQRVVQLYLTDEGTQLLAQAPRPAQGAITDILHKLPDEILANMDLSLTNLVGLLDMTEKDSSMKPLDL